MFSMAVAGLVKSLIAVTVTLNPAAAYGPGSDTIRPGDTLSAIAARAYGSAADWPVVWWANRRQVANPDVIAVGQRLHLPASGHVPRWMARSALAAIPDPAHAPAAPAGAAPAVPAASTPASSPVPASAGGVNWSAIAACESGGTWAASTGTGFLQRSAVHRADLTGLRRRPVRLGGEPGHPGPADRRGPAGPGGPGHRRLARVRGRRLEVVRASPACTGFPVSGGRQVTPSR